MLNLNQKPIENQSEQNVGRKQPRRLMLAFGLLLVALIAVVARDHDFWFGSDETSMDGDGSETAQPAAPKTATPENQTAASTPNAAATKSASAPIAVAKNASEPKPTEAKPAPASTTQAKTAQAKTDQAKTDQAKIGQAKTDQAKIGQAKIDQARAADVKAAEAKSATKSADGTVVANRTVLPPLDVEVVAGNKHSAVHPGSNQLQITTSGSQTAVNAAQLEKLPTTQAGIADVSYPVLAQHSSVQGSVVLQALISPDGVIENLRVLSGPSILTAAAQQAVREWHFKPYLQNGQPVETKAKITVNFSIKVADTAPKTS